MTAPSKIKQQGFINVYRDGPAPRDRNGGDMSARVWSTPEEALQKAMESPLERAYLGVAGYFLYEDDTVSTTWTPTGKPEATRKRLLDLYTRMTNEPPGVGDRIRLFGWDLAHLFRDAIVAIDAGTPAGRMPDVLAVLEHERRDVANLRKRTEELVAALESERAEHDKARDSVQALTFECQKLREMVDRLERKS